MISNPSPRLTVVLEGRCRHVLARRGERIEFPGMPGDVLFFPPHGWNVRLASDPTRFAGLVFARGYLRILENLHPGGARTRAAARWHHAPPLAGPGLHVVTALCQRAEAGGASGPIDARLAEALLMLAREHCLASSTSTSGSAPSPHTPRGNGGGLATWQAVGEHLHDHAHDPGLSRDSVARRFRIHPSHLSQLCSHHGGAGFHAWLEGIRLERARRMLSAGDAAVAEVMRACGYADAGTGIRAFRRVFGTTPGVFRRLN